MVLDRLADRVRFDKVFQLQRLFQWPLMPSSKASLTKRRSSKTARHLTNTNWLAWLVIAGGWMLTALILSSRIHLVMGYAALDAKRPELEPFLASSWAWGFASLMGGAWLWLVFRVRSDHPAARRQGLLWLSASQLPLLLWLWRVMGASLAPPLYWEPLWFSLCSGLSFSAILGPQSGTSLSLRGEHWLSTVPWIGCVLSAAWWYSQTAWYYDHYQLGFNDFGQFALRVVNTAEGRGLLRESPVLPTFWDHFNPGLLLFVPLWKLFPSAHLIFLNQAICLSAGSLIVWRIAKALRQSSLAAALWSVAWLAQPALGQMNLAYTYGWHPISLAVPLLLASVLGLLTRHKLLAGICVVGAMLMNEAVMAVVCISCCTAGLTSIWLSRSSMASSSTTEDALGLSSRAWLVCGLLAGVAFAGVYRFSGLAEFQSGRFIALGDNTVQVMLSPLLRPQAFWGELFQFHKVAFLLSLTLPCFVISLLQGWRWLLAAIVPLGLLLVWDHRPAACLAFQYPSSFLPLLWLATMSGASKGNSVGPAAGALSTGLVLSLFVGQLPYSSPSLADIVTRSYGIDEAESRGPATELGNWLEQQVDLIRQDQGEVLATGRIAAHLLGNRDIETVGQYLYRKPQLTELPDRKGNPILHYRWIVLDRREAMQQTPQESQAVEIEARSNGFVVHQEKEDIIVFKRD